MTARDYDEGILGRSQARTSPMMLTKVCEAWKDLSLRTDGGLSLKTDENTRKWLALSNIVTATKPRNQYIEAAVFPGF